MNIAFRVDSSFKIGTGHIYRCLNLAKEFKKKKIKCVFFSNKQLGNINYLIQKEFDLYILNKNFKYSIYSKTDNLIDANSSINLIKKLNINYIFKDHYYLNNVWEKKILNYCKIVNISDFLKEKSLCDYYINYNLCYENKLTHKNLKKNCVRLIGPDYCITKKVPKIKKKITKKKKITIFMGGVDKKNYTGKLIKIFSDEFFLDYELDIIVGIRNKNLYKIIDYTKKLKNFRIIIGNKRNLYSFFLNSKLVITGVSTSMYEHFVLGINSIVLVQNKLQRQIMRNLKQLNVTNFISSNKDLNKEKISQIIKDKNLFKNNKNLFKNDGVNRIIDYFISKNILRNAKLTKASENDKIFLFKLFNEPEALKNSLSNKEISLSHHHKWLKKKITDKNSKIFIFKTPLHNLGQVRFDKTSKNKTFLTYSVTNEFRGKKIGFNMLRLAIKLKVFNTDLYALVKKNNEFSKKIFKKLGFLEINIDKVKNSIVFYKKNIKI